MEEWLACFLRKLFFFKFSTPSKMPCSETSEQKWQTGAWGWVVTVWTDWRYGGRGWSKIKSRKTCVKEREGRRRRSRATRWDWSGSRGRASPQSASQEQKDRVIVLMSEEKNGGGHTHTKALICLGVLRKDMNLSSLQYFSVNTSHSVIQMLVEKKKNVSSKFETPLLGQSEAKFHSSNTPVKPGS